jgi:hypothetical protein
MDYLDQINISRESLYVFLGISILLIILIIWIIKLELRFKKITRGKKGLDLEEAFQSFETNISDLNKFRKDMESYLRTVEKRLRKSVQGISNINFNAFQGLSSGGCQSFAVAFVNENGDGVIISTLHSRERVNVFSKEIRNWKSIISLTDEEQRALTQAQESCKL